MFYFKTFTISKIGSKMLNLLFYKIPFFFHFNKCINFSCQFDTNISSK